MNHVINFRSKHALPEREYVKTLDLKPENHKVPAAWRPGSLARHWGMSAQSIYRLLKTGDLQLIMIAGAKRITEESAIRFWESKTGQVSK